MNMTSIVLAAVALVCLVLYVMRRRTRLRAEDE
jgi:hypothetical protein